MTEKCCRWKSTSGLDGKMLFAHILRTNRRIFEIQTAYVQVWSKWWLDFFILKNYFRFEQQNWKLALKQYFWKYFRSGLNG